MKLPIPKNQTQDTLLALILNRSLTSIELRQLTKSSYPAARIKNIKDAGISIIHSTEKYEDRRGRVSHISRYLLATPINQAKKIYKSLVK